MMSTFFQSRIFGEFQEKIPYRGKSWALLAPAASCLVIKMKLPLGFSWLWVPYGPLIEANRSEQKRIEACSNIFDELSNIAKEERAIYARIEPFRPGAEFDFLKSRWRIVKSPERYTPECSLILDLGKPEGEILAQMKPKGRYNIQIAKRHNVLVQQYGSGVPEKDFAAFYEILKKTAGRDKFRIHPKYFYEILIKTFGPKGMSELFLAYYEKKVVGGIIVIFYKDTATYYYGASSYEHRNLMAPYLLQWTAIREARRRGMKYYDFLGISPDGALRQAQGDKTRGNRHPWVGVTEFKKKFGGREVSYPQAFDIIYCPIFYKLLSLRT